MESLLPKWPFFSDEEIEAALETLRSGKVNYWTGNETKKFEKEFANYIGSEYGIATSNGSTALTMAYSALNIGEGDEVITTPRTYIATASSLVLLGAKPVFADVDLDSGAITPESIEPLISPKTKAIAVVHIGGWPARIDEICDLAKKNNIPVIEDCSQAHGASINGLKVGSFGDVSTWSFCQDKIMTTGGEGGMVTTNNKFIWQKMWTLKDHGKSLEKINNTNDQQGFKWLHDDFGTNFRLTEFQSAIGRKQLKLLPQWIEKRGMNAKTLIDKLKDCAIIRIPIPDDKYTSAWYKFYCYLKPHKLKTSWNRDKIISAIMKKGFPAFHGGCSEIYLEKCFEKIGISKNVRLNNARELGETSIMFLTHPTIKNNEMISYSEAIFEVFEEAAHK